MSPFDPQFEDLPAAIPVFPLPEVLLLPGGMLPLNIFEPRYLAMVEAALAGQRTIGMVQPQAADMAGNPALFKTGCAGRICRFEEARDGRYLISLKGVCRFDVAKELALAEGGYRQVTPDWSPYRGDLNRSIDSFLDRDRLFPALRKYFDTCGIEADWETLGEAPDERLVTCLAMICPFSGSEKQALLEAPDQAARGEILTTLVEMGGGRHDCSPVRQ